MVERPIYLNLFKIYFPMSAVVSFLHRLSGVFLVLFIPLLLWMLQESLASEERFETLKITLNSVFARIIIWGMLLGMGYHLIAGIRHLLMDLHIGESKSGSNLGAWLVLWAFAISVIAGGYWIWK